MIYIMNGRSNEADSLVDRVTADLFNVLPLKEEGGGVQDISGMGRVVVCVGAVVVCLNQSKPVLKSVIYLGSPSGSTALVNWSPKMKELVRAYRVNEI